ncbi:MAG: exosortase-associated EpsI family protein [Lentisphaerae bacterium]|jgi:hypothetical protein|nr:exosortase-associated EpsI family protein [Lentisphaerota bacterium]
MGTNSNKIFLARIFVIAALGVAAWAMVCKTGVDNTDEAGIVLHLPEQVGVWQGMDLLFCPNRDCGGQYFSAQLEDPTVCPRCGGRLGNMNWAERSMLPADTGMARKFYVRGDGRDPVHATIVLSGDDRSSIHRPQVCMTAAGHEIVSERIIRIPLATREQPLEVMVMDMSRSVTGEDGAPAVNTIYYAYWFVGKNRETASHLVRMAYMAYDRVRFGVSHRWAYIALSGGRDPRNDDHLQMIADFASRLHPALLAPN